MPPTASDEITPVPRFAVERRGIEEVPDAERRGRPRGLGLMWTGLILNVQVVVYGALLADFHLSWWQYLLAIVLGNLTWVLAGLASLAGPAAGTTTFTVSRAPFGRNGNRPIAFFNWLQQVGYEVVSLAMMVLAAAALLKLAGVEVSGVGKVVLVLGLAVLQSVLPVIGHAAITRVLHLLVVPFAALFAALAWLTADRLVAHPPQMSTPAGWPAMLGALALTVSVSGLSWTPNGPDYSRYLPRTTGRRRIVTAVTLGGGLPQVVLMVVGAAAGLVVAGASDPISGLPSAFPLWFVVPYFVLVLVQLTMLNAIDLYSSGVTLQAIGLRIGRWKAVLVDGVICAVAGLVVAYSDDFTTLLSNFLLFMVVWFAPWSAVFIGDYLLRRGHYAAGLLGGSESGAHGVFLPGVLAQAAGMVAALLWIHTTVFTGPLSTLTGQVDLSAPAGFVVGGLVYLALAGRRVRRPA
jgi:nucleobase:cation symporter-1, NCS1 family